MSKTKLQKIGNSTGVILNREILAAAGMSVGGEVTVRATDGKIEIARADDDLHETVELGLKFMKRYPRTMAALAK
jgi:antitoxin component of MazEF toxin-antitoxin module